MLDLSNSGQDRGQISDRSLMRRLRSGSEDAATQLYQRYATRLLALARSQTGIDLAARVDAEDIVQSVFRTFFRRAHQGDYNVPEGEELWKLFLVMGLNKIRKVGAFHRAAKRSIQADAIVPLEQIVTATGDENSLTVLRMVIDEVLADLAPAHREIIHLRIEGHEVQEIAARLGRSKRSIERILQGFRETLSQQIHEGEPTL